MSGLILIYHTFCFHYVFMTGFPISRLSSFLGTMKSEQSRLHFCCTVINTLALPVGQNTSQNQDILLSQHRQPATGLMASSSNMYQRLLALHPGFPVAGMKFCWIYSVAKQVKLAEVGVNGVVIFAWNQQEPSLTTRPTQLYVENCTLFIVRLLNGSSTSLIKLLSCRFLHGLIFQLNHYPQSSQMQRVFLPVCSWNVH